MAEITRQVGASSDDCDRELGLDNFLLINSSQEAGYRGSGRDRIGGGMRFTNITIPQGATINGAHLTLKAASSYSGTDCNTRISAEDVDDAPTFADDKAAFDARWAARTTARVDWDNIPEWTPGTDYNSPEIKTVIQEIVDRGGWASGQAIVIFWEDYEDRSTHATDCYRTAYPWDVDPSYAPKLVIDYTEVGVVGRSFGYIIG